MAPSGKAGNLITRGPLFAGFLDLPLADENVEMVNALRKGRLGAVDFRVFGLRKGQTEVVCESA